MKAVSFVLALLAFSSGLISAYFWYKSSKIEIVPLWAEYGGIEPPGGSDTHWIIGMMKAAQKSSHYNKFAALWTAVSVCFSVASAFIGAWPF